MLTNGKTLGSAGLGNIPNAMQNAMQNSQSKESVVSEQLSRSRILRADLCKITMILEERLSTILSVQAEGVGEAKSSVPIPNKLRNILEEGNDELSGISQALSDIISRIEL